MPIDNVAVADPVQASTQNKLIAHANGSPGRAIFTANGLWSIPQGVYKFKVYLAGGGGKGSQAYFSTSEGFTYLGDGARGGDSPLCSKMFAGLDIGTSFSIVIGAGATGGGPGGTSTFGALLSSSGGTAATGGGASPGAPGGSGSHNGEIRHTNQLFQVSQNNGYGQGGEGGTYYGTDGSNGNGGICIIEW